MSETIKQQIEEAKAAIQAAKDLLNKPKPSVQIENLTTGEVKSVRL